MIDEKILSRLRNSGDYVSGEDLCRNAGVSRAAIWKHIEKLRSEGYEIDASPHLGYRLSAVPDALIPSEIKWRLRSRLIGREVISYRKADSTNDIAYALAERGVGEGAVVIAEEQIKGKGRHGRSWSSPAGSGIYMSIVLKPRMAPGAVSTITLMAAVAAARAIREVSALAAMIKWPNDILINHKKVCGILTEMKAEQDAVNFVIIGIGINVNTSAKQLPKGASSVNGELSAVSAGAERVSRISLARKLLEFLDEYYFILKKDGFGPIIDEWKGLTDMIGSRVRVALQNREFEALAHDIDPDGMLVVRTDAGTIERVSSGDVTMLRFDR